MVAASSSTTRLTSAGSAIRVTRPIAAASRASSSRPVSSRSLVRASPRCSTSRAQFSMDNALPSVRAMGTPKRASGVHTRRSHASAIAHPAPAATPSTWAMVGTATRSSRARHASRRRSYARPSSPDVNSGKLRDVGPGAEDAAGRADDEHAYGGVGVHAFAGVGERVVHRPRHGVAGPRAIEREIRHRTGRRENRV